MWLRGIGELWNVLGVLGGVLESGLFYYYRRAHHNVAVVSHAQYVPTLTAAAALRVKAALSKVAW